jgi:hypothetical protein
VWVMGAVNMIKVPYIHICKYHKNQYFVQYINSSPQLSLWEHTEDGIRMCLSIVVGSYVPCVKIQTKGNTDLN